MAISRALDSNNDILLSGGRIAVVEDGAQVAQHVRTRLLFYFNEWFLDLSAGTPWYEEVFVKPANLNNVESVLRLRISQTPELAIITEFSMALSTTTDRILSVSFTAETEYGEINIEEIFING